MRKLPSMADPYESMRHLLQGTSLKVRYHSSGNDGDHVRGEAFYAWQAMFPASFRVQTQGVALLEGSGVDVVRNPSAQMAQWLRLKYNTMFPSDDLLIIDGSAPWWGGPDTHIQPDGALSSTELNLWRIAILKITPLAAMIVVPWFEYATYLREERGLPAMCVPDHDPEDEHSLDTQLIGWSSVFQAAILAPYLQTTKEKTP